MAFLAASICLADSQPLSTAFNPYSPKDTSAPRPAFPGICPLNCFLNFDLLGCSILRGPLSSVHPHFNSHIPGSGQGGDLGIINVRPQGLQWNRPRSVCVPPENLHPANSSRQK